MIGDKPCGVLGELNPFAQKKASTATSPILLAELQLDVLAAAAAGESRKLTVNRFQPVIEDFSFCVNESVMSDDLVRLVREAAKPLSAEVNLIGIYRGASLPTGQKSLTYRIVYRHADHAPTEGEVNAARKTAIEQAAKSFGATLRGG
jgi:phenylalanyl-tRNA synthetase beta chain